jgi:hypothetical protein
MDMGRERSAVSLQLATIREKLVDEGSGHASDLDEKVGRGAMVGMGERIQVFGLLRVGSGSAGGTRGHEDEADNIRIAPATPAFGDIVGDGGRGPPHPASETGRFASKERAREPIGPRAGLMRLLPHWELTKILHRLFKADG